MEKCLEIINEYEPSAEGRQLGQLGIDGLQDIFYCVIYYVTQILTTFTSKQLVIDDTFKCEMKLQICVN